MNIAVDFIQFIETAIMFSITLFCIFLYIKTKDHFIAKTLGLLLPTSVYFLISYSYSYFSKYFEYYYANEINKSSIGWVSYFFAIFAIAVIAFSIITVYRYGLSLFPLTNERKNTGFFSIISIAAAFLIFSIFFITLAGKNNLTDTLTNVIWIVYPAGSLPSFVLAVVMLFYYKRIRQASTNNKGNEVRLVQYFLISFLPQIIFSALDFLVLQQYTFQFTHISYLTFGFLSFYYITNHYFRSYENTDNINIKKSNFSKLFDFSEREIEVLKLLLEGKTNTETADILCISINTVKSHIKNIYKKATVSNRVQLIHKIRESLFE